MNELINWLTEDDTSMNYKGMEGYDDAGASVKHAMKKAEDISAYLKKAEVITGKKINGIVADLGAGRGTFSALLSNQANVAQVYAVEYSLNYARHIMPEVFKKLSKHPEKIQRIVGDFNRLKFKDGFFDFVFELGAFHHSEKIRDTIQETSRILKKGGYFIGIDRSHPDSVTDAELEAMLNIPYPDKWKQKRNFPLNQKIVRKDWGEHEYRNSEWVKLFEEAGFKVKLFYFFEYRFQLNLNLFRWLCAPLIKIFEPLILKKGITKIFLPGVSGKSKALIIAFKE